MNNDNDITLVQIEPGRQLADMLARWNCDEDMECEGACLATAQLTRDLVTCSSLANTSLLETRYSDIILISLINMYREEFISVYLTGPGSMIVSVAITTSVNPGTPLRVSLHQ